MRVMLMRRAAYRFWVPNVQARRTGRATYRIAQHAWLVLVHQVVVDDLERKRWIFGVYLPLRCCRRGAVRGSNAVDRHGELSSGASSRQSVHVSLSSRSSRHAPQTRQNMQSSCSL